MRILILGGTEFLGRHLVGAALEKGHEVTLFNRGQTNPGLFHDVEKLRGDRDGNLDALRGRTWDAVFDTSGYVPRGVRRSVELLKDSVLHCTFVSSISVYADFSAVGMDESAPAGILEDESDESVTEHYGALKALCEKEVQRGFGERALVIRPGLIVGPHDPTDRFTYWVRRFSQGGEALVPGRRDYAIQFVDARDLARWMVRMAEKRENGVFNATGPASRLTMGQFVHTLERVIPGAGNAAWVGEEFLLAEGVREFIELPLWISDRTHWPGFMAVNIQKAVEHGLTFRKLEETILDTLHWDQTREPGSPSVRLEGLGKVGLSKEREDELLWKWKKWDRSDVWNPAKDQDPSKDGISNRGEPNDG